jgi:hypothetical protein
METTAEPTRHDTARISEEDQESTLAETLVSKRSAMGLLPSSLRYLSLKFIAPTVQRGNWPENF